MEQVLEILKDVRPECDFAASTNFVRDGLLDSFDVVTLVSTLDAEFGIAIAGTDIVPENFQNLEAIEGLLRKYGAS